MEAIYIPIGLYKISIKIPTLNFAKYIAKYLRPFVALGTTNAFGILIY